MQLLEHWIAPALEPENPICTPFVEAGSPRRSIVPTGSNLLPVDGAAYLVADALSSAEADRYLGLLWARIDWLSLPETQSGR